MLILQVRRLKKLLYEFANEIFFEEKALRKKSTKEKSLTRSLQSPFIMASRISKNILAENPNELCNRLNLLL